MSDRPVRYVNPPVRYVNDLFAVRTPTLDAIKGPYKGHTDCLRDMLKEWLYTSPDCSWQSLIRVLRSPIVGKEPLASHLESIYCPQEGSVPPPGKHGYNI